jgi:alpha-tubulin suppressor-like RCC1 family protein
MKRISIFLITAALIAGMVGCVSQSYALAIASTAGGSVTTPGEGMFTYEEGTVVNLTVEAEAGYHFINWTGDVGTITNVEAATAVITMDGSYFIRANFAAIPPIQYNLTVSSTAGGSVTAPGEGTFAYGEATMADLTAEAGQGYRFINWTGDVGTIANVEAAETTITMDDSYSITANFGEDISMVVARDKYTVGLKSDGTVVAVGDNDGGQCDVGDWTDIVQVAAGCDHTVGIRSDGTVVAVGDNFYGQCDVGGWTDIVQVAAGCHHTVGLKSDGTVAIVGIVGGLDDWTHIVQVAAAFGHTVGLKSDGTVVDTGYNVSGWTDIVQVATDRYHTVGLKSDGSLVSVGNNSYGQCSFGGWTDIVQVAAGYWHTVGLKSDGTVVAVGNNGDGQCDVGDWTLN